MTTTLTQAGIGSAPTAIANRPELAATIAAPPASVTGEIPSPPTTSRLSVLPRLETNDGGARLVPTHGPRYHTVKRLGVGGMGEVALVEDRDIGRSVAMKRLLPAAQGNATAGALARFVDEVRIVGKLEHPNIVPIHDVGVDENGEYFFVMKYVEGETLEAIIERLRAGDDATFRAFDFTRRIEIFVGILRALQYAHERGILHRDIKPANVMIGRFGEVLLMDWGIARPINARDPVENAPPSPVACSDQERASSTHVGLLIGTPSYMSPEQACGKNDQLDARSDLYAACVLFHELLGLRHRHEGATNLAMLVANITTVEPPSVTDMFPGHPAQPGSVPPELGHFLRKGLRLKREERWESASVMIDEMHAILDGRCRVQCPATFMKRSTREVSRVVDRSPRLAVTAAFATILVLIGLITLAVRGLVG
jgi:serine/threonine protein kinase